jgi:hypothetical protein
LSPIFLTSRRKVERSGVGMLLTWVRKFVGASCSLVSHGIIEGQNRVLTPYMYAGEPRDRLEIYTSEWILLICWRTAWCGR